MKKIKNIAIIGAGPSGISVYLQLVKEIHNELTSITLFDPQGIAKSFSFNTDLGTSLTNTSVGVTSLYADDKLDYFKWLQDKKPEMQVSSSDFISRHYFIEYCQDRFLQSKEYASSFNCSTLVEDKEVTHIAFKNEKLIITNIEDIDFVFDAVILATGVSTLIPDGTSKIHDNFIPTPYPERNFLNKINDDSEVLIIGSKLSAIDVSVAIHNHYPNADITMVSRSGKLPSVRNSLLIKSHALLDGNVLNDLNCQLSDIDTCVANKLERDILSCKSGINEWEDVVGQFIEEFNEYVPTLPTSCQEGFLYKYQYFIKHYVSSFPLSNAEILLKAIKLNKLNVIKQELKNYLSIEENKIYGKDHLGIKKFDVVINASGICHKPLSKILSQLLSTHSVKRNKEGGVKVNTQTMKVLSDSSNIPLYAIGGPATGEVPITNYVRSSATQAKKIVDDIAFSSRKSDKSLLNHYV